MDSVAALKDTVRRLEERIGRLEQTESGLRQRLEALETLSRQSREAFLVLDAEGRFLQADEAAEKITGYTAAELQRMTLKDVVHPAVRKEVLLRFQRRIRGQDALPRYVGLIRCKDGEALPVEVHAARVTWEGRPAVLVRLRDARARVRAFRRLKDSRALFRVIAEKAPHMIFIYRNGRVVYVNERAQRLLGHTRERLRSRNFDFLSAMAPESRTQARESFQAQLQGKEVPPREYILISRDGRRIPVLIATQLIDHRGERAVLGVVTDLTVQKEAEATLAESEARFRNLVEQTPAITYVTSLTENRSLFVSPQIEPMLGIHPSEFTRKTDPWLAQVHPEDRDAVLARLQEAKSKRKPFNAKYRMFTRQGEMRWIRDQATVVTGDDGRPLYFQGLMFDISEEVRAREELQRAKDTLESRVAERTQALTRINRRLREEIERRATVETDLRRSQTLLTEAQEIACLGDFERDLTTGRARWSDNLYRLLGYQPGEMETALETYLRHIHPEDRPRVARLIRKGMQTPRPYHYRCRIVRRDGTERIVESHARVRRDVDGRPMSIHGTVQDITTWVAAEQTLRQREEQYRLLVETMNEGLVMADAEFCITYVNRRLLHMLGYNEEDVLGRPAIDFVHKSSKDVVRQQFNRHTPGGPGSYQVNLRKKNGRALSCLVSAQPFQSEAAGFSGTIGVITDITELKRRERALQRREKQLEAQKLKLEELNTALRVMLETRKQEQREMGENMLLNLRKLVLPHLHALHASRLSPQQKMRLEVAEENLVQLTSPLARRLTSSLASLTPTELRVADLIRHGKTSRQIAELFRCSKRTIDVHRYNIRRKLNLLQRPVNLHTYLMALEKQSQPRAARPREVTGGDQGS